MRDWQKISTGVAPLPPTDPGRVRYIGFHSTSSCRCRTLFQQEERRGKKTDDRDVFQTHCKPHGWPWLVCASRCCVGWRSALDDSRLALGCPAYEFRSCAKACAVVRDEF